MPGDPCKLGNMRGAADRLTIYEVANETLCEFYLTSAPAGHGGAMPQAVAHWDFARHGIQCRVVESELRLEQARAFVKEYRATCERLGWKVVVDPALD